MDPDLYFFGYLWMDLYCFGLDLDPDISLNNESGSASLSGRIFGMSNPGIRIDQSSPADRESR